MSDKRELWSLLNAGKKITDGETVIWYDGGLLYSTPELVNPLSFEKADEGEWYELIEDDAEVQRYCRWYYEKVTGEIVIDNNTWHPLEHKLPLTASRMNEAYTKEDIVGNPS